MNKQNQTPSVETGYTRLAYSELTEVSGQKAILFDLDGDEFWIPKSVCKVWKESKVVDILTWYYEKEIEGK